MGVDAVKGGLPTARQQLPTEQGSPMPSSTELDDIRYLGTGCFDGSHAFRLNDISVAAPLHGVLFFAPALILMLSAGPEEMTGGFAKDTE
jgi:hypothetical protein